MSKNNSHTPEAPFTQNQNNAMSDDPGDDSRNTFNPAPKPTVAEKVPDNDAQDQERIEELGRKG